MRDQSGEEIVVESRLVSLVDITTVHDLNFTYAEMMLVFHVSNYIFIAMQRERK